MNLPVLLSLVMFVTPAVLAQAPEKTPAQERLALRAANDAEAAKLPTVKVDSIREVLSTRIENGRIVLDSPLKTAERDVQVIVPSIPGVTTFKRGAPVADAQAAPFQLLVDDLTAAEKQHMITMISNIGRVLISRDFESDALDSSVQYLQDPPSDDALPMTQLPVRLFIHVNYADESKQPFRLDLEANDFIQLRRQNSAVVDQYLRPIFQDFGQEAVVFAIPGEVAWQVLGGAGNTDEQTTNRVKGIIARLDSDEFRERQKAAEELKGLGRTASQIIATMDRSKLTPQQSSAIDSFLAEAAPLQTQESSGLAEDRSFLLDVLFSSDAELRKLALKRLSDLTSQPIALDEKLSEPARTAAIAKLRTQLLPTTQPR
jgi:hypothetical protein